MRQQKTPTQKAPGRSQHPAVSITRFALTYVVLMGLAFFLIGFAPLQKIVDINGLYTNAVIAATSKMISLAGIPCSEEGSVIHLPAISLDVKFGCNGLEAVMLFAVAVIAYPAPLQTRLIGIAAGFLVLQVANIIRIAFLAYVAVHMRGLFDLLHVYVAQGLMIALALGTFFLYLAYAKPPTTKS